MINGNNNQNGNNNTQNNHHNTTLTFNIVGFGSNEAQLAMIKLLVEKAPEILNKPQKLDIPYCDQVNTRVCELVDLVHRNPECKELQNIYVTDSNKKEDNVLIYDQNNGWVIGNWGSKNKELLGELYTNLKKAKISSKQDTLQTIKQIFVLAKCGALDSITKIPDNDVERLYKEIGERLGFDTIIL
jgi:hypothetical protein